ncbi:1-deoxy-D-xylulose-5-phosphate reductoisomerase [Candidatus Pelagibacter sp.]|nr:1-deoxy-D-xylulose-5-phosphate reductoisomerase [Candidatus Pelagibacter sp.]
MISSVAILGSTGSIGNSTLSVIAKNKQFKIKLLTTNKNANKILRQAIKFKVKNIIITDKSTYYKYRQIFKKKKINLYFNITKLNKIIKKKLTYTINAISGIEGLEPTLRVIPLTKNILIANKESIICGWDIISKKLKKNKTNFIPIDSEHFSILKLIEGVKHENIDKVILTASGGPFLNKPIKKIKNIKPKYALNHPNWKMGKKISIDSSTMMNKVLEFIEAKKIFNLKKKKISILIHPSSYVHAIVILKGNLIKFLAHQTNMRIPISNALGANKKSLNSFTSQINNLNNMKFLIPNKKQFKLLTILDKLPENSSYFETILISLNDTLVSKYLNGKINYISIQKNLLNLIESPYLKKFYKLKPKKIYDIKKMIKLTKNYLNLNLKFYND